MGIREKLEKALKGPLIEQPLYLVSDWFVNNRPIDWQGLFDQGLGQLNHAGLIEFERPNIEIIEKESFSTSKTALLTTKNPWWISGMVRK